MKPESIGKDNIRNQHHHRRQKARIRCIRPRVGITINTVNLIFFDPDSKDVDNHFGAIVNDDKDQQYLVYPLHTGPQHLRKFLTSVYFQGPMNLKVIFRDSYYAKASIKVNKQLLGYSLWGKILYRKYPLYRPAEPGRVVALEEWRDQQEG